MIDQDSYKRAMDTLDGGSEITVDSLMKRRHMQQKQKMKKGFYTAFVFSFLFLGSNIITYAQSGEPWIAKVLDIHTGNGIQITMKDYVQTDPNVSQSEITINTDQEKEYCSVEDGRVYFNFEDTKEDITDYCNGDSYFEKEYKDENGYRHIVLAGGSIENPGWAEYILDEEGKCIFNMKSDTITANMDDAEKIGKVTVVNHTDEGTGKTEAVCVYEETDEAALNESEDLPAWLEKAEKDLKIVE
ncbi:MAG: hypothetical protein K6E84_07435 [Lachnospiraceae bacterium]|nr:hypothetical protein [Lachnospiraceae bacterium]